MVKLQPLNVVRKIRIIPYSKTLLFPVVVISNLLLRSGPGAHRSFCISGTGIRDHLCRPGISAPIYSADTGQVSITVPDSAGNSELIFMYGLGGWANDSLLYQMSGQVDSICFIGIQGNHTSTYRMRSTIISG